VNILSKRKPHNFIDLTGQTFGRLTVIKEDSVVKEKTMWLCQCLCGKITKVPTNNLRNGTSSSCGCLRKELLIKRIQKHGMAKANSAHRHRLYKIWSGMKTRCHNKNEKAYKNYGGRGITVCDEWLKFEPFYEWATKNGYYDTLEIDRIDNNGNYEPSNCRWVTSRENQLNKRNNRLITINGVTKTITEWSELSGINLRSLETRLRLGWSGSDLLKPVGLYERNRLRKRDSRGRLTKDIVIDERLTTRRPA
jgi:hypothetical protein